MPTTYTKKDGSVVHYNYYKKKEGPIKRTRDKAIKTKITDKIREIDDKQLLAELYEVVNNFIAGNSQI